MPAVYIANMTEAGYVIWRPQFSIPKEGPKDGQLIIKFTGTLTDLPWLRRTSQGYEVNFDVLRSVTDKLFQQDWLRDKSKLPAQIYSEGGAYNAFIIDIQL